jgi:hypothetical protein
MQCAIEDLHDVEDVAPRFGFDTIQAARFARRALDAERTGPACQRIEPGRRGRAHRHESDGEMLTENVWES